MIRSERWSAKNEIKRYLTNTNDEGCGAGPVLYIENGNRYCDDSESHIAVIGKTGKGKTQCGSLPFCREVINKGESLILMDPKKEGYNHLRCYIPEGYQIFCVDFRSPRTSPTKWNPLNTPYRLFKSANPDDNDVACDMVSNLWSGVYPKNLSNEQFWTEAAANYAKGLTYALFEKAGKEYVNLDSVAVMMQESGIKFAGTDIIGELYEMLPADSLAKRNLATYSTAPHETKGSIHSVASSGLEVFSRSRGLMKMLSCDTLNILGLDVNRPFALFIVLPDETDVYDSLAGLLVSQVSQHLIRVAQSLGGKLPVRVNIVLEELGSVGKSIPTLPNLMVAGRSRGIRLMLVLQSNAQLVDVYGKSKAETINSCIGITMAFSTNCWETLSEWSNRCGERQVELNNSLVREPLVTATQLAAMPTKTALVMVDSIIKFVSPLPLYNEMYDNSGWKAPADEENGDSSEVVAGEPFSFLELVKSCKKKNMTEIAKRFPLKPVTPTPIEKSDASGSGSNLLEFDLDEMISRIDKQIGILDSLDEKKKSQKKKAFDVVIYSDCGNSASIAQILALEKKINLETAFKMIKELPVRLHYQYKWEAEGVLHEIEAVGGIASIEKVEND